MLRTLLFFVKLAVLVLVAVWLADRPGTVSMEWLGYRVDTSVGVLLVAVFVVAVAAALVYRFWHAIRRAPRQIARGLNDGRRRRGYKALTQGMVAVAAGDVEEARRWSRKADSLLDEPPLTMLLSAQAAQLDGDDQAAKRYFLAMLERAETKFLGLRGLLMQSIREGDEAAARGYLREAYALRPHTPWVLESLFDLSQRAGELEAADRALEEAARHKVMRPDEVKRKRAVVLLERALAARTAGDRDAALRFARESRKLAPDLVPATILLTKLLIDTDSRREAGRILERAWAQSPHPDLVPIYCAARPTSDGIRRLKELDKLVGSRADHPESCLALAEAALEARLWGEARRHLEAAAKHAPEERVCHLMARLEEAEHGDGAKAREWLRRSAEAPAAPAWVCESCGSVARTWTARCGSCACFDSLRWRSAPRAAAAMLPSAEATDEAEGKAQTALPPAALAEAETPAEAVVKAAGGSHP